jgi:hypothetical protein
MTTQAPAGSRPVAVAAVAVQAVQKIVQDPSFDRAAKKAMVAAFYRVSNGTASSRESGLTEGPDWECTGGPGATMAFRERLTADGRQIPEVVGLAEDDVAAGRQAAELLGRAPGQPVPGYGDRAVPTATVDDRTTVLDSREVVQNGLSTDSPVQQAGAVARTQTGSRVQHPQQDRSR